MGLIALSIPCFAQPIEFLPWAARLALHRTALCKPRATTSREMEEDSLQIEEKIKWGDGFAVVYSVTDRCSFDEVMRLCFLINHIHSSPKRSSGSEQPPVVIVANKKDLEFDRMVSTEDGENLSKALKLPFYEISTRDSYEETVAVFNTLYQELMRQGHFSPGSFKRRTVSKLMEKIPKMQASSTLNSAGRSLSFNSFRDYIPE
ncbi:ras-related and estrogen-regulated growth inhibitor-like [Limosa lapponica baueri]|uniref:small monomeric GTPase n=1 Tax=Limosa lapponica baueri TaxID=1758121 RepID=A0A2I0T0X2_LIMLA|nr:ras-related and estrogen-regulated growth inhibitor-like [Limosa lapponica baueri]